MLLTSPSSASFRASLTRTLCGAQWLLLRGVPSRLYLRPPENETQRSPAETQQYKQRTCVASEAGSGVALLMSQLVTNSFQSSKSNR